MGESNNDPTGIYSAGKKYFPAIHDESLRKNVIKFEQTKIIDIQYEFEIMQPFLLVLI